jgi:hypothetical protein
MAKTSQDYVRYVEPLARAALERGGFHSDRGMWRHGRRAYAATIINRLIASGDARRDGNRVVAA